MNDVFRQFLTIKEKDSKQVRNYLTEWQYQLNNKKRKLELPVETVGDYQVYNGPEDILNWMKWISGKFPNIFGSEFTRALSEKALERDKQVLSKLNLEFDFSDYHSSIGLFNAYDHLFTNCYPVPAERKISRILDFGAGFGRQANLFTLDPNNVYVGMDGIAKSYTLQNLYYRALVGDIKDYVDDPQNFKIETKGGIYHLPTWRYDLMPDNFFDLVLCVQVLPELDSKLVKTMIGQFHRTLKTGGMLYVFDHGEKWKPGGRIHVDRYLSQNGFTLEFRPHLADGKDIHGQIRIYRKTDSEIIKANSPTFKTRYFQFYTWVDAGTGGLVSKMAKLKKKIIG